MPKIRTCTNFTKNDISFSQGSVTVLSITKVNSVTSTVHIEKSFDIFYGQHETLPQAYAQFCNKHNINILLVWANQYLKGTLWLKFQNNVELARVLVGTLKIRFSSKYYSSVGQLISEFPLPKLSGTCRIINNICRLLRAVRHFFEVTDCYLTKTLRGHSHLISVTVVDIIVLPNNELTAQQVKVIKLQN
jgi:hypothetical protein